MSHRNNTHLDCAAGTPVANVALALINAVDTKLAEEPVFPRIMMYEDGTGGT